MSKVARIGKRTHARDALPPSTWRDLMKRLALWFLHGIIGTLWLAALVTAVAALTRGTL